MEKNEKLIAILGGGDWADAYVEHLIVPHNLDMKTEFEEYRKWYRNIYCVEVDRCKREGERQKIEYLTYPQWLINRGAKKPNETDIEIIMNDNW